MRTLLLLCLVNFSFAAFAESSDIKKDTERSFRHNQSSNVEFAKNKPPRSFYMGLQSVPLWVPNTNKKCAEKGFFKWLKKQFVSNSKSASLLATVVTPLSTEFTIPLYQVGFDETSDPKRCYSNIPEYVFTPLYLMDGDSKFTVKMVIAASSSPDVIETQSLIDSASGLLTLTGSTNGWLVENVSSQLLGTAVGNLRDSISQYWTYSVNNTFTTEFTPWLQEGDAWDSRADSYVYDASKVLEKSSQLVPTLKVEPYYLTSLLSVDGGYLDSASILTKKLATTNGSDLNDLLLTGLEGFNTDGSQSITSSEQMSMFCKNMKLLFSKFLTRRDALAARYSVLEFRTNYKQNVGLRNDSCISSVEELELAKMNTTFLLSSNVREKKEERDLQVREKLAPVTRLLKTGKADINFSADIQLKTTSDILDILPETDQDWGGVGDEVIKQIKMLEGTRTGCYTALPNQDLSTLLMVGLFKSGSSAGISVSFDAEGNLSTIFIAEVNLLKNFGAPESWPQDCPLI